MKTVFFKHGMVLFIAAVTTFSVKAQTDINERYNNYRVVGTDSAGRVKETIHTVYNNNEYKIIMVNGVLCALDVNGEKIPAEKFTQYDAVINSIKQQIEKDEAQAKLDRAQADRDRVQADKDRQQASLDQIQAGKDREQAEKDRAQADKDREQARLDQIQAGKDRGQAEKDRAQAVLDRAQAEKDREQAAEDRKLMRQMIADIIADGIVPEEKSICCITLDSKGMTVNGKQQPDAVFAKYKEKYSRWAENNFSYGGNQQSYMGVHMSKVTNY
jgi:colicin import membrane protein